MELRASLVVVIQHDVARQLQEAGIVVSVVVVVVEREILVPLVVVLQHDVVRQKQQQQAGISVVAVVVVVQILVRSLLTVVQLSQWY